MTDEPFLDAVRTLTPGSGPAPSGLTEAGCVELFEAQATSRHLDLAARRLKAEGDGFYTIGSAGHESNAAVAMALRPTDPALLHYRSGGFYVARARQVPGHDPVRDVLLGLVSSSEEPIAGGRHKVFGHPDLAVIPQTSTVGSHLPRAVGVTFAIERARGIGVPAAWPADSVVVCSFGDASANHSTVTGAVNAASWSAYQGMPLPLLFLCEDNGIGISVPTPPGWVARTYGDRPGLRYFHATGADPAGTFDTAAEAAAWVREHRRPAFLHLTTVRLLGHAGSDVESAYRTPAEIAADHRHDPLLGTARLLVGAGIRTPDEVLDRYEAIRELVWQSAAAA
ncbi:MAG: thiamine pyrophosphate-dependent enzyme, partial [Actinophytocola sp.]|uniref:thiamine pyrophosphate-dependent enzyme n=1 Tax=Actinophytocola sp. TaxID=1872138 RepID=UPI003D6B2101